MVERLTDTGEVVGSSPIGTVGGKFLSLSLTALEKKVLNLSIVFWWFNAVVTPLPIPNRVVKRRCADGTRKGRVGNRQNRVLKLIIFCYN